MQASRAAVAALGAILLFAAANARAQDSAQPTQPTQRREIDPTAVSGVVQTQIEPGDQGRYIEDRLLWIPRQIIDYAFIATDSAAGIVTNQQIVPRVEHLVSPRPGNVAIFPTAFVETGQPSNFGARMIATGHNFTTSLRGGFGGLNEVVGESKVQIGRHHILPSLISIEGMTDRQANIQYFGVGEHPGIDPRNQFRDGPLVGLYRQQRSRVITSYGVRPLRNVELFVSTSIMRRSIEDDSGSDGTALSQVFVPASTPGAFTTTTIAYGEVAVRLDTRADLAKPSPGGLLEAYAGAGRGLLDDDTRFLRFGGRAAAFIPLYRLTNIISPKVVIDALERQGFVPFAELPGAPEFRGFDTRRDNISITTSIDYRYAFMKIFAARGFFDATTVVPRMSSLSLNPDHWRFAAGAGLDFVTPSTELGRIALAVSSDGVRLLLTFGIPKGFGDRQHRGD